MTDFQILLSLGDDKEVRMPVGVLKNIIQVAIDQTCQRLRTDAVNGANDPLYTIDETMAILRVDNRRVIERWAKSGYLPKIKVGKKVRYRKSDIDRILIPKSS